MYKIVVVGLKQVYEAEYYKAYAVFYDFIRSTDYNVMLYSGEIALIRRSFCMELCFVHQKGK